MTSPALHYDENRRTLRAFATWQVLGRLRRRWLDGGTSPAAAKGAKDEVAEAAGFLRHLLDQTGVCRS